MGPNSQAQSAIGSSHPAAAGGTGASSLNYAELHLTRPDSVPRRANRELGYPLGPGRAMARWCHCLISRREALLRQVFIPHSSNFISEAPSDRTASAEAAPGGRTGQSRLHGALPYRARARGQQPAGRRCRVLARHLDGVHPCRRHSRHRRQWRRQPRLHGRELRHTRSPRAFGVHRFRRQQRLLPRARRRQPGLRPGRLRIGSVDGPSGRRWPGQGDRRRGRQEPELRQRLRRQLWGNGYQDLHDAVHERVRRCPCRRRRRRLPARVPGSARARDRGLRRRDRRRHDRATVLRHEHRQCPDDHRQGLDDRLLGQIRRPCRVDARRRRRRVERTGG